MIPPGRLSRTGLLLRKKSGVGMPASYAKSARKDAVDKRLSWSQTQDLLALTLHTRPHGRGIATTVMVVQSLGDGEQGP